MNLDVREGVNKQQHFYPAKGLKKVIEGFHVLQWQNYIFDDKYIGYKRDRDLFLLRIFTGYYYSDLKTLLKSEFRMDPEYGYYLYSERFKNDNLAIVPLWKFSIAMDIVNEYREEDPGSPYLLRRDALIEDQSFNRNLKIVAGPKMLNWPVERTIYNKLGRRIDAQLYIRFGTSRPQLSRMLGNEGESITKSYFQINLAEIIGGVKNVDFVRLGIGVWSS